jgi:hypothetical protein
VKLIWEILTDIRWRPFFPGLVAVVFVHFFITRDHEFVDDMIVLLAVWGLMEHHEKIGDLQKRAIEVEHLKERADSDWIQAQSAMSSLTETIGELAKRNSSLESRTDACERVIGTVLGEKMKDPS